MDQIACSRLNGSRWIEAGWNGPKWISRPKWTQIDLIDQNAILIQLNKRVTIINYSLKLLDIIYNIDK